MPRNETITFAWRELQQAPSKGLQPGDMKGVLTPTPQMTVCTFATQRVLDSGTVVAAFKST